MNELTPLESFWILAGNTLVHELGVPLPFTPTAFVLGARGTHGGGDLLLLIAAIVLGVLIGNSVWFAVGRRYGAGVLNFLCRFSLTADTCVSRTEKAFGRWGWSSLVIGRFLPGVSLVAPPLAGALGMSWGKFLALTTAGAVLYSLVVLGAGILLRDQIDWALRELHRLGWQRVAGLITILALYIAWRWWRRRVARAPDVARISVDELEALIAAGERPLVVDVRGRTTQQIDPRRIPAATSCLAIGRSSCTAGVRMRLRLRKPRDCSWTVGTLGSARLLAALKRGAGPLTSPRPLLLRQAMLEFKLALEKKVTCQRSGRRSDHDSEAALPVDDQRNLTRFDHRCEIGQEAPKSRLVRGLYGPTWSIGAHRHRSPADQSSAIVHRSPSSPDRQSSTCWLG